MYSKILPTYIFILVTKPEIEIEFLWPVFDFSSLYYGRHYAGDRFIQNKSLRFRDYFRAKGLRVLGSIILFSDLAEL